jgi:hypothetical protein
VTLLLRHTRGVANAAYRIAGAAHTTNERTVNTTGCKVAIGT